MPSDYACRNCNLVFTVGGLHGFGTPVEMFSRLVCNQCGHMYQLNKLHYSLLHPLDTLRQDRSSLLSDNDFEAWRSIIMDIADDTLMSETKKVIKSLSIDDSFFNFLYKGAKRTLKTNIDKMTVVQLRTACENYRHSKFQQYAAQKIVELSDPKTYWLYQDGIIEEPSGHLNKIPSATYKKKISKPLIYYQSEFKERKQEIIAYQNFRNIKCVTCGMENYIGEYDYQNKGNNNCPRCNEPKIENVGYWIT